MISSDVVPVLQTPAAVTNLIIRPSRGEDRLRLAKYGEELEKTREGSQGLRLVAGCRVVFTINNNDHDQYRCHHSPGQSMCCSELRRELVVVRVVRQIGLDNAIH